eukprot:scaffold228_cov312-Pinguiococcus_pyrenoidosus.AAC.18
MAAWRISPLRKSTMLGPYPSTNVSVITMGAEAAYDLLAPPRRVEGGVPRLRRLLDVCVEGGGDARVHVEGDPVVSALKVPAIDRLLGLRHAVRAVHGNGRCEVSHPAVPPPGRHRPRRQLREAHRKVLRQIGRRAAEELAQRRWPDALERRHAALAAKLEHEVLREPQDLEELRAHR